MIADIVDSCIVDSRSETGTTQISEDEHVHEEGQMKTYGIREDVKPLIISLDRIHLKPRAILRNLRDREDIQIPTIEQLNNFLKFKVKL